MLQSSVTKDKTTGVITAAALDMLLIKRFPPASNVKTLVISFKTFLAARSSSGEGFFKIEKDRFTKFYLDSYKDLAVVYPKELAKSSPSS